MSFDPSTHLLASMESWRGGEGKVLATVETHTNGPFPNCFIFLFSLGSQRGNISHVSSFFLPIQEVTDAEH